jgi:dipeptidase D
MMTPDKIPFEGTALEIKLSGLAGGHSGAEINCGRANANKLMGRILSTLLGQIKYNLVTIAGGSKDNAIPRECRAIIAVADDQIEAVKSIIKTETDEIYAELSDCDKAMTVICTETDALSEMISDKYTRFAVTIPSVATNGVMAMSADIEGLVEYSRNLGVIKNDGEKIEFIFSSRSSVESRIDASCTELDSLAAVTGCETKHYSRYPGWKYEKDSPLRDKYIETARRVLGKDAIVEAIHAGLECGIIKANIPYMDIISIGPDMRGIHSPDEELDLDSFARLWTTIEDMLK